MNVKIEKPWLKFSEGMRAVSSASPDLQASKNTKRSADFNCALDYCDDPRSAGVFRGNFQNHVGSSNALLGDDYDGLEIAGK